MIRNSRQSRMKKGQSVDDNSTEGVVVKDNIEEPIVDSVVYEVHSVMSGESAE